MATYAYTRISIEEGTSVAIDDQLARIEASAFSTSRTIERTFIDRNASGKSLDRPAANEMFATLKAGDTIFVYRLDRLTRSVADINKIMEQGINIVSICESLDTATAAGRMVINMLATFAQYERELIVERTTASLSRRRVQGQAYCFAPFGWENEDGKMWPIVKEQAALRDMKFMRAQGKSYDAIAKYLNKAGIKPHRGKMWYAMSVSACLNAAINQEVA